MRVLQRETEVSTVALRYFSVFGSRQHLSNTQTGVCSIFLRRLLDGKPPIVFEDGRQTRDFIHVSDVAVANRKALEHEDPPSVVNIGSGTPTQLHSVATILSELVSEQAGIEPKISGEYREIDVRHCYADTTRAESQLGFKAQVALKQGLQELVSWAECKNI
jgi:dTDP-L-rhamnose 4-epimerase